MLQAPFFTGLPGSWTAHGAICALAAIGDLVIAAGFLVAGALVFGDSRWYAPPTMSRYVVVLLAGVIVQVMVELVAVHGLALWAYTRAHPRLPVVDVGILPVLAAALYPLTFRLLARWEAGR